MLCHSSEGMVFTFWIQTSGGVKSVDRSLHSFVLVSAYWWWCYGLGMPETLAWDHTACDEPHRHFPDHTSAVTGPALMVLIMIVGHTSATTIGELWRIDLLPTNPKGTWNTQGHTTRSWIEGGGGSVDLDLPLLRSKGRVSRVSQAHSLLEQLKCRSGN